ncbi:MAG: manganese efflux pump MntP family protein [Thermomicrobiales bacterium]|nr:manganese efflux pump MntP family protein [Thermomicrobiales bacterium]
MLGRALGDQLGTHATYFAGVLLALVGGRAILEALQHDETVEGGTTAAFTFTSLAGIALVISMDKFAAGLSLAASEQSLTGFMAYLIVQTFLVSILGFWLGTKAGDKLGAAAELLAGGIFVVLGLLIIYQTWQGGKSIV